jgi:hypothetical protein
MYQLDASVLILTIDMKTYQSIIIIIAVFNPVFYTALRA